MKNHAFIVAALAAQFLLAPLGVAQTQATATAEQFATVVRTKGDVTTRTEKGAPIRLVAGATVAVGDTVVSTNGEALLKTLDGGMIGVRPDTRFLAEAYAANGKADDRQLLRLLTGAIRVVSGWIGSVNRAQHKVITPTATIGIRGTDHEVYILAKEHASDTYPGGTYDKVNRGGTTLAASAGSVDIPPGKAGFVRDPSSRTRALMTLLMPVLLEKVPDFFVAGSFDDEIDRYSRDADREAARLLEQKRSDETRAPAGGSTAAPEPSADNDCGPQTIARDWLERFDGAIAAGNSAAVIAMLAPDASARATVRSGSETVTIEFDREELVASSIAAISSVKDFKHRRTSLEATINDTATPARCQRLTVRSIAIEQGVMNGKAYQVEALEEYALEKHGDAWLATRLITTQR